MASRNTPTKPRTPAKAPAKAPAARKQPAKKRTRPKPPPAPITGEAPRRPGRPSKYDPHTTPIIARGLAKGGATDLEIADALEINADTLYRWQARYPAFSDALKCGKGPVDERTVRSLYRRAIGYSFDAVKIHVLRDGTVIRVPYREHVPPDTTACIFWLKNRDRENWRDKIDHEHAGAVSVNANFGPPTEASNG